MRERQRLEADVSAFECHGTGIDRWRHGVSGSGWRSKLPSDTRLEGTRMTVAEVRELFAYNAWANRRVFAGPQPPPPQPDLPDPQGRHRGLPRTLCPFRGAGQTW